MDIFENGMWTDNWKQNVVIFFYITLFTVGLYSSAVGLRARILERERQLVEEERAAIIIDADQVRDIVQLLKQPRFSTQSVIEGSDQETEDRAKACVICASNVKQCACVPCGHLLYCISCANKRQESKCPMCRKSMKQVIRIFT
jgi:hypothetical protein